MLVESKDTLLVLYGVCCMYGIVQYCVGVVTLVRRCDQRHQQTKEKEKKRKTTHKQRGMCARGTRKDRKGGSTNVCACGVCFHVPVRPLSAAAFPFDSVDPITADRRTHTTQSKERKSAHRTPIYLSLSLVSRCSSVRASSSSFVCHRDDFTFDPKFRMTHAIDQPHTPSMHDDHTNPSKKIDFCFACHVVPPSQIPVPPSFRGPPSVIRWSPSHPILIMVLTNKQKEELSGEQTNTNTTTTTPSNISQDETDNAQPRHGHIGLNLHRVSDPHPPPPLLWLSFLFSDKSILGYLKSQNYTDVYNALVSTLQSSNPSFHPPSSSETTYNEMLEKKWSSIIRMNKKIMELEALNTQLKEDVENAGKGKKMDLSVVLPREPCKLVLKGHRDGIRAVQFHPVYSLLATASEDATIKVWDYESGRIERTLQGHQDAVLDIDFSASGSLLASCSADLSIKIWNFESTDFGCIRTLQGHNHTVSSVVFVPSGDFLLSASRDHTIKLWELATGYCTRTFTGHDQWVRTLSVHPSGLTFCSGSMDQTVRCWNIKSGELLRTFRDHDHVIECVTFSNGLADGFINQFRQEEKNGTVMNGAASAAAASSSAVAAASSSAAVAATAAASTTVGVGSGGLYIASSSRDRTIRIYEVATGSCIKTLIGHDNWINGVIFHPSGRFLLSSSDDKSIRIWDITKGFKQTKKMSDVHDSFVSCLAWNKNQPMMATGGVDAQVKIFECR